MLYKENPFLRICLPFGAGILSGVYLKAGTGFFILSGTICIVIFLISLFMKGYKDNLIYGLFSTIIFFLTGSLLYTAEKNSLSVLDHEESLYVVTVSDYPVEKAGTFLLTVRLNNRITENSTVKLKGSVLLYIRKDHFPDDILPGDILTVWFTPGEIKPRGNPCEFDYPFYMENHGIKYFSIINCSNIVSHRIPEHRNLRHKALMVRDRIIRIYRDNGITGDRLALAAAVTLGQKNMLEPEQKSYFRKSGVMHIMAVSGLHTAIISLFVFNILFFLKRRYLVLRILITVSVLWSFAFVTGLTPSVMRAAMMFSFLHAGNLLKRPVNSLNSVLASAFVLMVIRPSVIFDAGFLLSYSAVIFIVVFYRDLYQKIVTGNMFLDKIWQSASVTLTAQAGTMPLTIAMFNSFPVYFIITNILIVPLASLLVILGCLIPLSGYFHQVSSVFATVLCRLTDIISIITKSVSSLPLSTINNIGLSTPGCILLWIMVFLFCSFFLRRKPSTLRLPLIFTALFLLVAAILDIHLKTSSEIVVYNTPGHTNIGIRNARMLHLYSDTAAVAPEISRHCSSSGLRLHQERLPDGELLLNAGKTMILVTGSLSRENKAAMTTDYIILTGLKPLADPSMIRRLPPGTMMIVPEGTMRYRRTDREKPDNIFIVKKYGAFIRRI